MKRDSLLTLLRQHTPFDPEEHAMWQDTIRFVEENPDCFERWLTIGHVTGSAWIVDESQTSVLLMHHRKLDKWFQPGGHADGDSDVLHVALKEALEETGLKTVHCLAKTIFDVDVHLIPANAKEAAHYHYDIRFLFRADSQQPLSINSESKELVWVPLSDVEQYNNSNSILRMVQKMSRPNFLDR
ncbi:NUDIX hydrolase [Runella slithyformis]|uniref:NUDIX hydrolase n=1 Tax=Runella slithyformis (strain ATCC 29530 / DSM 19594 / LMG 11500 / NCIMB 11436 / LSU 4) TaxID=761193 RepID=A0A7U4E801_RUNSL|nr:NUDIX hydrolase [Runella slithyformis]AEI50729.1 NUDIX hydrolase [Runella slithyformis DSM 19594]